MYTKETETDVNEFFRIHALAMSELHNTIQLGENLVRMLEKVESSEETIEVIKEDTKSLVELQTKAKMNKAHMEDLIERCIPEKIVRMKLIEYSFTFLAMLQRHMQDVEQRIMKALQR